MKLRLSIAVCLAAAATALWSAGFAAEDEEKKLPEGCACPVSGQPASLEHSVTLMTKDIYFCCPNCPAAFKKSPEKFAAKAAHQLLQTEQIVQIACPISGQKLNPETAIDFAGAKVAFCCENCQARGAEAVEAGADKALALLFAKLEKTFTLQNKCPVSGRPIDVAQTVSYQDKAVYFCCENCLAAFEKEPEKFVSKLPQFQKEEEDKESDA